MTALDRIKIFADGASLPSMLESAGDPRIGGFTTNPTLMRTAQAPTHDLCGLALRPAWLR